MTNFSNRVNPNKSVPYQPAPIRMSDELASFVTPITDDTPVTTLPSTMRGVIIYHNASRRFYSTLVNNPFDFYAKINSINADYYKLSKALRIMLDQHPAFEFFYTHERTRIAVENMMVAHGYRRVTTTKGEMQIAIPHLFSIADSSNLGLVRWVIAQKDTEAFYLLKKANKSFSDWVTTGLNGSGKSSDASKRERVLAALGYNYFNKPKDHFKIDKVIFTDHGQVKEPISMYSALTQERNNDSVDNFLRVILSGLPRLLSLHPAKVEHD